MERGHQDADVRARKEDDKYAVTYLHKGLEIQTTQKTRRYVFYFPPAFCGTQAAIIIITIRRGIDTTERIRR